MKNWFSKLSLLLSLILISSVVKSQDVDIRNFKPTNYVTDMAGMLSEQDASSINNWISAYEKQTSVEIAVVIINRLPEDVDIHDYAVEQFRRLGVGKAGANNGVLIALSKEDRKWNITTGYGIEGLLPDITCSDIGNNDIVPNFKQGDYYGGIMAALEHIKSVVGTDQIEDKKLWVQNQKIAEERKSDAFWSSVGNFLLEFLIIGALTTLVVFLVRKHIKKVKADREEKERKEKEFQKLELDINTLVSDIEKVKKAFPNTLDINGSLSLTKSYNNCKNVFMSVTTSTEVTNENRSKLKQDLLTMSNVYKSFRNSYTQISNFKSSIIELNSIELECYNSIVRASDNHDSIVNLGYTTSVVPSKFEVDKLHQMIVRINGLIDTDIDEAIEVYKEYVSKISSIKSQADYQSSRLSSVQSAINRVKNWQSEVNKLSPKFKTAGGNGTKLNSMITSFSTTLSVIKDAFVLGKEIDKIVSFMNSEISVYENEQQRKRDEENRRKRERDEEDRRRRQREDDDRRRQQASYASSQSSYSSSSSSFGGFGGGSSGGGGASGGW